MVYNALSNIANDSAHNSSSTTIILETSMVNAIIPSVIVNTGINHCRIVVTTTITVVVMITTFTMIAINTIIIIITSTRLLLLLLLA